MQKTFSKFILSNLLLTAFCTCGILYFYLSFFEMEIPPFVYISIIYFPVTGIANHYLLSQQTKKEPRKFVNAFMLSSSARILLAMIVITICILTVENPVPLVLVFALQYFLFFILEIYFLLQLVKEAKESDSQH